MKESNQGTLIMLIWVLFSLFLPIFGWTVAIPPEKKTFESISSVILTSTLIYSCEIPLIMFILKKHGYKASDLGSLIKIIDRMPKVRFYEMSEKDRAFLNDLSFVIAVFPLIVFIFGLHIFEYGDVSLAFKDSAALFALLLPLVMLFAALILFIPVITYYKLKNIGKKDFSKFWIEISIFGLILFAISIFLTSEPEKEKLFWISTLFKLNSVLLQISIANLLLGIFSSIVERAKTAKFLILIYLILSYPSKPPTAAF